MRGTSSPVIASVAKQSRPGSEGKQNNPPKLHRDCRGTLCLAKTAQALSVVAYHAIIRHDALSASGG